MTLVVIRRDEPLVCFVWHQHWRAFPAILGWGAAPVLEFVYCFLNFRNSHGPITISSVIASSVADSGFCRKIIQSP